MNSRPPTNRLAQNRVKSTRSSARNDHSVAPPKIPDAVVAFIHDQLYSVEELEVLLLLRSRSDRAWTVKDVSDELCSTTWSVTLRLFDLHSRGLLRVVSATEAAYSYAPSSNAVAEVIDQLAPVYEQKPHTVISLIFAKAPKDHRAKLRARRFSGR